MPSKLSTFVIDCHTDDLAAAATFWSKALMRPLSPPHPGFERYRDLACAPGEPLLLIQRVSHDSRVHLDIESDDIEAEVARLEALGAKALERVRSWVVMEAPTGHRFCVVRVQRPSHTPPPFSPTPEHAGLAAFVGAFQGTTRTFLDPEAPPDDSADTLHVEPILGGRWLRLQWFGQVAKKPRQGEMWLGFHRDGGEYELTWVDTFHTGTAQLRSTGAPRADGAIHVTGSYAAGPERWGWRTELTRAERGFTLHMVNIAPSGQEYPAVQTEWLPVARDPD